MPTLTSYMFFFMSGFSFMQVSYTIVPSSYLPYALGGPIHVFEDVLGGLGPAQNCHAHKFQLVSASYAICSLYDF